MRLSGAGESRLLIFELDLDETEKEREKVPYYEDWEGGALREADKRGVGEEEAERQFIFKWTFPLLIW